MLSPGITFRFRRARDARAYSLVEVMIAVGIFAVAMIGLIPAANQSLHQSYDGRERLYVASILESRLEEIRDLTFDQLLALGGEVSFPVLPATTVYGISVNPQIVDSAYVLSLTNASGKVFIDSLGTNLAKVTVRVTFTPKLKLVASTMETVTFIARNGINRQG